MERKPRAALPRTRRSGGGMVLGYVGRCFSCQKVLDTKQKLELLGDAVDFYSWILLVFSDFVPIFLAKHSDVCSNRLNVWILVDFMKD